MSPDYPVEKLTPPWIPAEILDTMSTTPLSSLPGYATSGSSSTGSSSSATATGLESLTPQDFIKMMITQLQNQDPTDPTSNEEILSQISQIGQLQSSDTLESDLSSMVIQNSISNAGSLIGKQVKGVDDSGNSAAGTVNSVTIANSKVYLKLDTGDTVQLGNVNAVAAGSGAATGTGTATTNTGTTTTGTTAT